MVHFSWSISKTCNSIRRLIVQIPSFSESAIRRKKEFVSSNYSRWRLLFLLELNNNRTKINQQNDIQIECSTQHNPSLAKQIR